MGEFDHLINCRAFCHNHFLIVSAQNIQAKRPKYNYGKLAISLMYALYLAQ